MRDEAAPIRHATGRKIEVGTLWTLERDDCTARCALLAFDGAWDLQVYVNEAALLSERCQAGHEVFGLAEQWKRRMMARGWKTLPAA